VQVAGVAGGGAGGGVAARDGPAPFGEQDVEVRQARVEPVPAVEVVSCFDQVAVRLQEHHLVAGGADGVDEGAAMAAPAVGGVGDAGPQEPPEAVADLHAVIHRPSSSRASRPLPARQSSAMAGVPQIGLPLTLREVLIRTGTPVRRAKAVSTAWMNGLPSWVTVCTRAVPLACTTAGICRRASSVTGEAIDMNGACWPRVK